MSNNQAIFQEVELDLQKIFAYKTPKIKKRTGYAMYSKLYEITKLIGELGLIQEKMIELGTSDLSLNKLPILKAHKSEFTTTLLTIAKNWVDIATILNLKQVISDLIEINKESKPDIDILLCKLFLEDVVDSKTLDAENINFYIYFLLDSISSFCNSAKNLALLTSKEITNITTEISTDYFLDDTDDEEDETELSDEQLFLLSLKDFSFLLLLIKFIAYKSGINFECLLEEYLDKEA